MSYAFELYFDAQAEAAVRHIWQSIGAAGSPSPMLETGHRPHVSLAVYDSDELRLAELEKTLIDYVASLPPFLLQLSHIGIFPTAEGVLFLGVTATRRLLELHATFHDAFAQYAPFLRPYYQVGHWVPHCTLSYDLTAENCADLIPSSWPAPLPLQAEVQEIGITRVSPASCSVALLHRLTAG